jgi:hypothetical protein
LELFFFAVVSGLSETLLDLQIEDFFCGMWFCQDTNHKPSFTPRAL